MLEYLVGFGVKFGTSFKANCTSQIDLYIYREREREKREKREREIALLVVVSLATRLVKT